MLSHNLLQRSSLSKSIISSPGILVVAPWWISFSLKRFFLQVENGFRHCHTWWETIFLKLCLLPIMKRHYLLTSFWSFQSFFWSWMIELWKSKNLPCSFGLTGRVHEEECDESFSAFCLVTKNCARFLVEKIMERREMIKRKIATLKKAFEKVNFV